MDWSTAATKGSLWGQRRWSRWYPSGGGRLQKWPPQLSVPVYPHRTSLMHPLWTHDYYSEWNQSIYHKPATNPMKYPFCVYVYGLKILRYMVSPVLSSTPSPGTALHQCLHRELISWWAQDWKWTAPLGGRKGGPGGAVKTMLSPWRKLFKTGPIFDKVGPPSYKLVYKPHWL